MDKSKRFVAILMGSDSDLATMSAAIDILERFGITQEVHIMSAHRTPEETANYVRDADRRGCEVFIAGAGLAAHLAGAVAAQTLKPVIGVPLDAGALGGMDALLSTVQMPGGIPVACVAIGKPGAKNAGYLAAQILALGDSEVAQQIKSEREANRDLVLKKDAELTR
ncbi:MAG TPA: 5-(carboxyamino)imidazole ribonucleotide mutase [Gammaproteobacteria bacterium]|nr:5-(carboxyamino)imidazole ribonucleotide mutase [Gammaproteobacteria bacterium]|tara:strand:- start:648 stop:1148 length:501 start_codon:yes stop_codon:yes gene_type:complete